MKPGNIQNERRKRKVGENGIPSRPTFRNSFVRHAVAEILLLTSLSFTLLRHLGWVIKLIALACYAVLLMPGFLKVGYYYFFSKHVRGSVVYGDQTRNRLDLYLPENCDGPKPVVAFVTGEAWIIGASTKPGVLF